MWRNDGSTTPTTTAAIQLQGRKCSRVEWDHRTQSVCARDVLFFFLNLPQSRKTAVAHELCRRYNFKAANELHFVCVCWNRNLKLSLRTQWEEKNFRMNTDGEFSRTKHKPGCGSYSAAGHVRHVVLTDIWVCVCMFFLPGLNPQTAFRRRERKKQSLTGRVLLKIEVHEHLLYVYNKYAFSGVQQRLYQSLKTQTHTADQSLTVCVCVFMYMLVK